MTESNDRRAFEQAIRASPFDRTLRLVYADWLDDRGLDPEFAAALRVDNFKVVTLLAGPDGDLRTAWAYFVSANDAINAGHSAPDVTAAYAHAVLGPLLRRPPARKSFWQWLGERVMAGWKRMS